MKYILLVILLLGFNQSQAQSNSSKDIQGITPKHICMAAASSTACTQNDAKCEEKTQANSSVKTLKAGMELPSGIKNLSNTTWAGWLWIVFRIGLGLMVFFGLYIYFTKRRSRITKRISARWVKLLHVHSKTN